MMRRIYGLMLAGMLVALLTSGCSGPALKNPTEAFDGASRVAKLKSKKLGEVSGMASSVTNPGLFWMHNDSGNDPEVYLVDRDLNILLTCDLKGIENRDWEDIAVGPGPVKGRSYLYVGDIGDNNSRHRYKYIYRFEEPTHNDQTKELAIRDAERLVFELSDKKKDTETLLLDPATRDLYVISKREEPVWVYRIKDPFASPDTAVAEKMISLPMTQIVAGDISPDGKRILLKSYDHVYYWDNTEGKSVLQCLELEPFEVPYEIEPQGEALAWARDNSGFYTLSEKNVGKSSYLYFYKFLE